MGGDRLMFELEGVSKVYDGRPALRDLSLSIAEGEVVALLGPSGSGKTTLLNLLAGLIEPTTGELRIGGRPSRALRPGRELARLVGIMHQQFNLVDSLAVVHNVLAGRLGEWGFWRSALSLLVPRELGRARTALERVGIGDKLYARTAHLSGGEQQRVALARLIVQDPRALLADEPVASLDPARAEDLIVMLTGIAREQGKTLVASLHSVDLALRYFSRLIALRDGRVYFDRPAGAVTPADLEALYELEVAS
ncbi:MAG TPA: ATP-binding cassette domain-containing protein [Bacillota bacterium]